MRKEFNKYVEDRFWAFLMLSFSASFAVGYLSGEIYDLIEQLLK